MNLFTITRAGAENAALISRLAKISFIESHGRSARPEIIHQYINNSFSEEAIKKELQTTVNLYHIISQNEVPAGFSKIIFNCPHVNLPKANVTKLERIYLLPEFHGIQLGKKLLEFNIQLARDQQQSGIWLFVWTENTRALDFYKKNGFLISGSFDFRLTDDHSNPNHLMVLWF